MIYIYDIVLNLNNELIEFFEWEDNDNIKYVRKLPFYKISSEMMKDLINNNIKISNNFLEKIKSKSLVEEDYNFECQYLTLFTDEKIVLGVCFDRNGNNKYISRLLLDEEEDILNLSNRINVTIIEYEVKDKRILNEYNLTRQELKIKEFLEKEFLNLFNNNKVEKLNYYYFEYFNKINNDKEKVYKELKDSLINNFNEKHVKLYEIIKLSYT